MKTEPAVDLQAQREDRGIVSHLLDHTDFLERHPEVLEHLRLHHHSGSAVSLIERQVDILRARNQQLQQRLSSLLEVARENEARVWQLNTLARLLIVAENHGDIMGTLEACLKRDFDVDAVFVGIKSAAAGQLAPGLHRLPSGDPRLAHFNDFFRLGRVQCEALSQPASELLFADAGSQYRSVALVPLGKPVTRGMLALASRDGKRFEPDMGTMFLELLADLVAAALRTELNPA